MPDEVRAWRCNVCGYVHRGDAAPESCPVCGAAAADFEPYEAPVEAGTQASATAWRCPACGYIHPGASPPGVCPVCGQVRDPFEPAVPAVAGQAAGQPLRLAIVGAGIAGVAAAEAARNASPGAAITLISREAGLPYYRLNLTRYIAGEITRDALPIHAGDWYAERRIDLRCGVEVSAVDPSAHRLTLAGGMTLDYDRLILAPGSHPFVPPVPGADLPGVVTLRTARDADRVLDEARRGRSFVCVGGGILGIETCGAIARRGGRVVLLESHEWLMPRQLNRRAGARLRQHLERAGVGLRESARTAAIEGQGAVRGVRLAGGETLPCDVVILATGVRPNTALARKAQLEVNQGILVDSALRTSAADILAAGDATEHNGVVYGLWGPSQYQGAIAGMNAVGGRAVFGGVPRSNTLKVLDVSLMSVGVFEPPDGTYLPVDVETAQAYTRWVFRDGKMVGALLVGDVRFGAAVKRSVESGADFSACLLPAPDIAGIERQLAAP